MLQEIEDILKDYKIKIKQIEDKDLSDIITVQKGIKKSRNTLLQLRVLVINNKFPSIADEINFFKNQKPFVNGHLIFFLMLYKYLEEKPSGSSKSQRKFIDEQLDKIQEKRKRYIDFEKYYWQKEETLDKYYFVRYKSELALISDTTYYFSDPDFSTSHDILVARIIAKQKFVSHLNLEVERIRKKEINTSKKEKKLPSIAEHQWTASKTDLVELIYAFQASGAIANGNATIKDMASLCEKLFDIDLGNVYRTYLEIRERKIDRTSFLQKLQTSLEKKMQQDDNNY